LYYPGYEDLSALLYTIGSIGFAAVDGQELLTFDGFHPGLRTNISLSFIGSVWYIIGSVVSDRVIDHHGGLLCPIMAGIMGGAPKQGPPTPLACVGLLPSTRPPRDGHLGVHHRVFLHRSLTGKREGGMPQARTHKGKEREAIPCGAMRGTYYYNR